MEKKELGREDVIEALKKIAFGRVNRGAVMRCAMAVAKVGSSSTTRTVRGITVDCADELSIAFRLSQSSGFKNTAPSAGTVIFADQSRE